MNWINLSKVLLSGITIVLKGNAFSYKMSIMKTIWLVIYVSRGFIQEPELFFDKSSALKRKREILKTFNRDYDEVEVFEKVL